MDIAIRTAAPSDAEALLAIYRPYVEETAITFETETPSLEEFRSRITRTIERYPWIVAKEAGAIAGYAYAGPFKGRAAYNWSVETSIYLNRNRRGNGLGRLLYEELERLLARMGVKNLNACIACTSRENDPHLTNGSIRFHERMGYTTVGTFHQCGFKLGNWYDMCWMEKMLSAHDGPPAPIVPFPQL